MDYPPKKLITRIVESAFLLALSAWLVRLAVCCLWEIKWLLLIIAGIALVAVILWRVYKWRRDRHDF